MCNVGKIMGFRQSSAVLSFALIAAGQNAPAVSSKEIAAILKTISTAIARDYSNDGAALDTIKAAITIALDFSPIRPAVWKKI